MPESSLALRVGVPHATGNRSNFATVVFFDAKRQRIYASCGAGFIAVIRQMDADHYEMLAQIPTVKMARSSLFDPETGRLYQVVPRHRDSAGLETWVYRARP